MVVKVVKFAFMFASCWGSAFVQMKRATNRRKLLRTCCMQGCRELESSFPTATGRPSLTNCKKAGATDSQYPDLAMRP